MKKKTQALFLAFVMLFVTFASPIMNTVDVQAAEATEDLVIKFHYSREDGDYEGWNLYTWNGTTNGSVAFEDEDGDKVATVIVGPTATKIGYIVRKSVDGNEWEAKDWDGDRFIDVATYGYGTIHVYVESGVEDPTVDYTQATEGERIVPEVTEDALVIKFYYNRPDGNYENWSLWNWDDVGTSATDTPFTADANGKMVVTYIVATNATQVGFIVKDPNWTKDPDGDRYIDVSTYVKYSLQGTTQGRYLTGGVPPVRFSM